MAERSAGERATRTQRIDAGGGPRGWPRRLSPAMLLLAIGALIFAAEALVMDLLERVGLLSAPLSPLLDAGILVLVLLPPMLLLYAFLLRHDRDRRRDAQALRDLSRRLIAAGEEERRRLARELHDDCGQVVAALRMELGTLAGLLSAADEPTRAAGARLEDMVGRLDASLRGITARALPPALDEMGLAVALREQVRGFSRQFPRPRVELQALGPEVRLPAELRVALYRVCQEALTNVARHAGADRAVVRLVNSGRSILLTVEDDGRGIDPGLVAGRAAGGGIGLVGMRERILGVGGSFAVTTGAGRGTLVRAEVPVPAEPPA